MVTRDEVVAFLDEEYLVAPDGVRDAIRIVRGHLRRHRRPSQQLEAAVVVDEDPVTARHHFIRAAEELKKSSEPPEG